MINFKLLKRIIKIIVAIFTVGLIVFLIVYFKNISNFETLSLSKWKKLSEGQKTSIINTYDDVDSKLLIDCVNTMSDLDGASKMSIKDALSLCYNGIKLDLSDTDD